VKGPIRLSQCPEIHANDNTTRKCTPESELAYADMSRGNATIVGTVQPRLWLDAILGGAKADHAHRRRRAPTSAPFDNIQ
jgi:hypothetical protein